MDDTELIEAYLNHQRARSFSARTIERRQWSLTTLAAAAPLGGHTPFTIEKWMAGWESKATRHAVLSDARMFYKWAVDWGLLDRDPTAKVKAPKVPPRSPTPLSSAELAAVLAQATEAERRVIMLGAYAGLRASEIAALDCANVDRQRGLIVVRHGKGDKDAEIELHPDLAAVLPMSGPAVPFRSRQAVYTAAVRAYRRVGLKYRCHDLRATFGTAVAEATAGDAYEVMRQMRHSTITTSQRYVARAGGGDVVRRLFQNLADREVGS